MLEEYIYHGAKKLRCGYTTGSCAAGAAKAAAYMLLTGNEQKRARLMTPKGIELDLEIQDISRIENAVSCAVRKDGGDDPDITDGILVYCRAEKIPQGITICGGEGIGRVTKAGLDRPIGDHAINTVPRKMITEAVSEVCAENLYSGGIRITVYVPGGAELARKTYNPRMGIEGGISIIGTSGIVEPMSTKALIDTIRTEAAMRKAEGTKDIIITLGNYGGDFLSKEMPFAQGKNIKCGNYIGEAIDIAAEYGFESALIVGHIGKLAKLGAGIMNTHSAEADGRMEVLAVCGLLAGCGTQPLKEILQCAAADAALDILAAEGKLEKAMDILMERSQRYLEARASGSINIGAVMFSNVRGVLGMTSGAEEIIRSMTLRGGKL